jgi:hypothetical protein
MLAMAHDPIGRDQTHRHCVKPNSSLQVSRAQTSASGPSRHFSVAQNIRHFRPEADFGFGGSGVRARMRLIRIEASQARRGLTLGPILSRPTAPKARPMPISLFALKGNGRRRGPQGRVFSTGTEAVHRAHSGNPAFRKPSITSFEFDCPPRAIQ